MDIWADIKYNIFDISLKLQGEGLCKRVDKNEFDFKNSQFVLADRTKDGGRGQQ
mgnify:CR=1 FL=1